MSGFLFPLPYDGSPQHNESWEKAAAFRGKRVRVVTAKGQRIEGVVWREEVSSGPDRRGYGVGFTINCGQGAGLYCVPVSADLQSIELIGGAA